jgi:glutamyl-tRNA reductase
MSVDELVALVAHARSVPADERTALAARFRQERPAGSVLVETCHRVELFDVSPDGAVDEVGVRVLHDREVVAHAVRLCVGLESAVIAEDQLLHQVRTAVDAAQPLDPRLDRLFAMATRAGRRARSWLPAERPSLADVALARLDRPLSGREVLVVGTGPMGRLSVRALQRAGATVTLAGRTPQNVDAAARRAGVGALPFDPGAELGRFDGFVLALAGRWPIAPESVEALLASEAWLIDLSSPPALEGSLRERLGTRLLGIDALAERDEAEPPSLIDRLERLATETQEQYLAWAERAPAREAAREVVERAEDVRRSELETLWRRLPELRPEERGEIENMTRHLADRLLQEPLERLGRDSDGRHERAARELFGL